MDFNAYVSMMLSCSFAILLFEIAVYIFMSTRLLAALAENLLNIMRINNRTFVMDFYGFQIDLIFSQRFRWSLAIQLGMTTWIISLLILDGLVMNVQKLSGHDFCPILYHDCFTVTKFSTSKRILCPSGCSVFNLTSLNLTCFVWIYTKQTAVQIINQMGICSSVFSLSCHTFKYACHLSRKWWGLFLLLILIAIMTVVLILSFVIENPISMTAKILLIAFNCLIANVIQLLHFTNHLRCSRHHTDLPITTS